MQNTLRYEIGLTTKIIVVHLQVEGEYYEIKECPHARQWGGSWLNKMEGNRAGCHMTHQIFQDSVGVKMRIVHFWNFPLRILDSVTKIIDYQRAHKTF